MRIFAASCSAGKPPLEVRIKRETGESPVQSRCCKLLIMSLDQSKKPLFAMRTGRRYGVE